MSQTYNIKRINQLDVRGHLPKYIDLSQGYPTKVYESKRKELYNGI